MALKILYGQETGIDTTQFLAISRLVEELSGVALAPNKPIVGRGAFAHESGMVVAGLLKDSFTGESYVPELVGQKRSIVLGKKAGAASVKTKLDEIGLKASPDQVKAITEAVKAEAVTTKRFVSDDRLAALARTILAAAPSAAE